MNLRNELKDYEHFFKIFEIFTKRYVSKLYNFLGANLLF